MFEIWAFVDWLAIVRLFETFRMMLAEPEALAVAFCMAKFLKSISPEPDADILAS